MSDRAKRVLDALIEYDANHGLGYPYPILTICEFFHNGISTSIEEDYESLTVDEEKQVIQSFIEFAY